MPLGGQVRYRVKTTKSGRKIRLAFRGHKVVETKDLSVGRVHTPVKSKKNTSRRRGY